MRLPYISYFRLASAPDPTVALTVSAFDKAGLTVTFGDGNAVIRKHDGTPVLTARLVKGMNVVDDLELASELPSTPLAMASLSQPVSLAQWHHRPTHCSPLTITEMSKGSLVNGLSISGGELRGKCEDCIIGCQTRRPFDGKTRARHGLPMGFLYLRLGRIVVTNFLKILS